VLDAFISGWISSKGPNVQNSRKTQSCGGVRRVAVSNGTASPDIGAGALGRARVTKMIVPDLTFAAAHHRRMVLYCRRTQPAVNSSMHTSPQWICAGRWRRSKGRRDGQRTKAIIPVISYGGRPRSGRIASSTSADA